MIIAPAERLKSVGEYYFSKKLDEVRKLKSAGAPIINLGIGSPDLIPSPQTLEAAAKAIKSETAHGYPSYKGSLELRQKMADWYKRTYHVSLNAEENILPLLGSKEGVMYVSLAFLNPGDGVLVPNPGYPAYGNVAKLIGARVINYDLTEKNNWYPDLEALENQGLKGVKLMWVNYPNMPTGKASRPELFEKLIRFSKKHNILICNDNPYSLVLNPKPLSILEFDPKFENTLELNSLSKAFNMPGWRVGMAMGSKDVIDCVLQVKSNADTGMFLAVQAGAIAAFDNDAQWHARRNEIYGERQKVVYEIFDLIGFHAEKNQVGLFVWAKAPDHVKDVPAFLDKILNEKHVFLVPGMIFGTAGARYARSSLCAPVEVLREARDRLR